MTCHDCRRDARVGWTLCTACFDAWFSAAYPRAVPQRITYAERLSERDPMFKTIGRASRGAPVEVASGAPLPVPPGVPPAARPPLRVSPVAERAASIYAGTRHAG